MRGPYHEFVLLPETGARAIQWQEQVGLEHALRLSDDLIQYLRYSLEWVESENPAKDNALGRGLNPYGPTAFAGEWAAVLASILRAWAKLFQHGPAVLRLAPGGNGEGVELPRDELVDSLNAVAALADQASSEGHWLLHLGV